MSEAATARTADDGPLAIICGGGSLPFAVADAVGKRGYDAMVSAFHDNDLMLRIAGDTLALTPPLIMTEAQIDEIMDKVGKVIRAVA